MRVALSPFIMVSLPPKRMKRGRVGNSMRAIRYAGVALVAAMMGASAWGQTPQPVGSTSAEGETLFKARCAQCHEPAVDRAPTREAMAARLPADITAALTTGVMQPLA